MVVKRAELRALWRAENPDEKQILAKLKEINAIRAKLQEKFVPLRIEVKKILLKGPGPKGKMSIRIAIQIRKLSRPWSWAADDGVL